MTDPMNSSVFNPPQEVRVPKKASELDIDYILYGNPTPEEISLAFSNDFEWYEEGYLVAGIKKHLRTDEHKRMLFDADLSIEDCLNGRYNEAQWTVVQRIYDDWNKKLGHRQFG